MNKYLLLLCCTILGCMNALAQDPFNFDGAAVLKNNKPFYFKNSSDTTDGTGIIRAGANALRIKYKSNALIFDALDNYEFQVRNQSDASIFSLDPDGFGFLNIPGAFGIGTTAPDHYLDIRKRALNVFHLGTNDGNELSIDIASGFGLANLTAGAKATPGGYVYGGARGASRLHLHDGEISFFISTTNIGTSGDSVDWILPLHLDNGGNIGMGTWTPEDNLHVKEYNAGSNTSFKIENSSPTSGSNTIMILKNGGGGDLRTQYVTAGVGTWYQGTDQSDSTKMKFAWNDASFANSPLTLTTAGRVGINTDSPQSELAVDGIIEAEKVKVRTAIPDYVFAEDYDLYTLPELETFIRQHKHLPNIQSEKEVAEDRGLVSLGEFNTGILENLETAILHLIELNKQQEELKVKSKVLWDQCQQLHSQNKQLEEQNQLLREQNRLLRALVKE